MANHKHPKQAHHPLFGHATTLAFHAQQGRIQQQALSGAAADVVALQAIIREREVYAGTLRRTDYAADDAALRAAMEHGDALWLASIGMRAQRLRQLQANGFDLPVARNTIGMLLRTRLAMAETVLLGELISAQTEDDIPYTTIAQVRVIEPFHNAPAAGQTYTINLGERTGSGPFVPAIGQRCLWMTSATLARVRGITRQQPEMASVPRTVWQPACIGSDGALHTPATLTQQAQRYQWQDVRDWLSRLAD